MSNSKETMTKKQQDDLASTFNNLPWGLPLNFPSMPPFGAFPSFGLPSSNFSALNSFPPPPPPPLSSASSLLSNDSTKSTTTPNDPWSNGLSTPNTNIDYNEYVKQLGLFMNAFNEKPQQAESEKSKTSSKTKSSKSKRPTPSSTSSDNINGKNSSISKKIDESPSRPTSTSSHRSSSNNPTKSSTSSSSHSKSTKNSNLTSSTKLPPTTTTNDSSALDPLSFAAATGGLTFPYFLPSLLSQSTGTNTNTPGTYPFLSLSSSLMNPAATLYPFLSPDWFSPSASSSKFLEGFPNLTSEKSTDSKESTSNDLSKTKQSQKHITSENKHLPLLNETSSSSKSKKRAKSIRVLTEEQELNREKSSPNNQIKKSTSTNPSLLHSTLINSSPSITSFSSSIDSTFKPMLFFNQPQIENSWAFKPINETIVDDTESTHTNGLNLSGNATPATQSADESRSNDDDDSDPNPKRRKTEEVNEALVGIPLARGWKRVTIVRAITRTGVRGDVSYYAPCGRKLRSFQEIDRYLAKKNITDLDRSYFTFSSKVHLGHFHEPKEGPDGKTIFQEFTEDEICNRILEMNPKFQRTKYDHESETSSPSITPSHNNNNVPNNHHQSDIIQQMFEDNRKLRLEQEEMAKRAAEIQNKRDAMRLLRNIAGESSKTSERMSTPSYQHNEFFKAIIEQQKQELEHKQKLQQEQQEQERKRQELAYLKQLELKKRQEEKLLLIEQRKAEKNAEREKKIQEKYVEIVHTKEKNRIVEDMQLKDTKPLPTLKPIENMRLSAESFANSLMIIQFLNNFKHILEIPDNLIPTLNNFQQSSSSSRDINSLCQLLLRLALDDPGIPNPKKGLTNLGQKLSEIDITEHTFSEILRLYIRERNGFDDKLSQTLSDTSFQSLAIDEKIETLVFLCNDLATNKRIVEEVDRNIDELMILKHEKLEIEKRLRRLKSEKSNSKKPTNVTRDKELNSSDNESPDESDGESTKTEEESLITNDPAAVTADDQDIETIDETKIDDLDKRLTLVTRKYALIKRRALDKHLRTRVLHLGQDRYRRHYWYFSYLPGIYVEGLVSGDTSPDDIKDIVENATKQKLDKIEETTPVSRSTQRKKQQQQQTRNTNVTSPSVTSTEQSSVTIESNKVNDDNHDEQPQQQEINSSNNLATMDLSAFCTNIEKEEQTTEIKIEPSDIKHDGDDNLPLDLSCSKSKRLCDEDYWKTQHTQAAYPLLSTKTKYDQFPELNDLATAASLLKNIKQENILDLTYNSNPTVKEETSTTNHFKEIEQTIREKFQYPQPLPIPDDVQSGWWIIQTPAELRQLMKSLAKRGQRERYLLRMLQRYFDIITNSMKNNLQTNVKNETPSSPTENLSDNEHDEHQQTLSSNGLIDNDHTDLDNTHEMDILNEIYNLSDRIISSSLHCRSYDINLSRKRLTYSDIQSKGSDVLDEAKHLLTDIERNIERRYLKHPFVRKYEINVSSLNRINQNNTYHHTLENSTNEPQSTSPRYDEVPQQLERWRRTVNESRTPAQLALCLTQLERCIAWERSIMRVYCEICNLDNDEEKLLLCDGCDHGTHTFCFNPPMSFIPPNDWFCYVCIGKVKGENLCFVCGNKGDQQLNRCEHCGKFFHEDCLKNAKQQRGKWLCVLCAANDTSNNSNGNTTNKPQTGRQTSRSNNNTRQPTSITNTNGDRNRSNNNNNNNRKSKSTNECLVVQESHSDSSHGDTTITSGNNDSVLMETNDIDEDIRSSPPPPTNNNSSPKKKSSKKSKINNDIKSCKIILNELLKSDVSWPFQTPVDSKEHPEYYDCINNPMDFSIIKKKMRNNQYTKREEFLTDVQLILNNCEYYNEDDSPVGQAGHLLRTFFQEQWTKQFG